MGWSYRVRTGPHFCCAVCWGKTGNQQVKRSKGVTGPGREEPTLGRAGEGFPEEVTLDWALKSN